MVIKNLKLKNYRRFRHLELEFPENIIGILGGNGSGKTTIVESIGWCLYGNRIRRTDKQDIRSQFCDFSDECAVELIFMLSGNEYRIVRRLKGKSASVEAAIYLAGGTEPEAVQERGVNEYIEKLLNLDYRSFFISVFARQKELAALSTFQPEERRKSIARLINIEAIDRARIAVRSDRKSKEDTSNGMQTSLKDEEQLKIQQKEKTAELVRLRQTQTELQQQFDNAKSRFDQFKEEFEKLTKKRDAHHRIVAQIEKWDSMLKQNQLREKSHIEKIKAIERAKQEFERLKPKLDEYKVVQREKEKLDKASSRYYQLQALTQEKQRILHQITREKFRVTKLIEELKAYENTDQILADLEKSIKELEKQLEFLRQELSKNQGLVANITAKGKDIRQKKEKIKQLGPESPCPVCTRPLKEHYEPVLSKFDKELAELRQQYVQLGGVEKELKEKIENIELQIKQGRPQRDALLQMQEQFKEREEQLIQYKQSFEDLNQNLKEVEKTIAEIGKIEYDEKTHKSLQKKYKELTEQRDQLLKHEENVKRLDQEKEELDQIREQIENLKENINQETDALKALNYDENNYLTVRKKVEEAQQRIDSIKEEIHQVDQKIIASQKDIEKITDELAVNKKLKQEINKLKKEIVYLDSLDYHFGIFRQELAGRIRPLIAGRAAELLHLTTQGRYSIMELDEDYNIYVYDQTMRFPLARFSGGEQDLVNLCLRVAISQVVAERSGKSQINFIVLDEIFGSQDEQRKNLVLAALQQLSSQFRQIFIITHVEGIKDALPVIVSVKEKSTMESSAEIVW